MKKLTNPEVFRLFTACFLLVLTGLWTADVNAQITVSGTAGGTKNGTYATLTGAGTTPNTGGGVFAALNSAAQTGAVITVSITGDITTEPGTNALGAGAWTSITITPSGARTISGTLAAALIDFNGSDNVTVDGLNSAGNSLTISNLSTSSTSGTCTIQFRTDATNNTITRCSISGSATMAAGTNGGNIFFGSGSTTTGNDNNTISLCNIGPAGSNLPTKCIYFSGTSNTDPGTANSGILINNNNIFDYFNATVSTAGIDLNSGSTNLTISNNKFYQTAARTQTTGSTHYGIRISNSSGNNYQVTGNTIGFASSAGAGTYTFVGVSSSSVFIPVSVAPGTTTASTISGNTIAEISVSGPVSGTSTGSPFRAIYVTGLTNVTGNTIGNMSATGSINITSSSSSSGNYYGIFNNSTSVTDISSNQVGGISVTNSSTGLVLFTGIYINTSSSVTATCNSNTIGGTVANSISVSSASTSSQVIGITGSSTFLPSCTITLNTIRNLTNNNGTGTGASASIIGILLPSSSVNHTVSQNTIHSFTNMASAAVVMHGLYFSSSTGTNLISRNFIHSFSWSIITAVAQGIVAAGGTATYQNNMVRLGVDASGASVTPGCAINGILESGGTAVFYHNSVYIGGSGVSSSANQSYAFQSTLTSGTRIYRNNIFANNRGNSGGGGFHVAIRIGGSTTAGITSNNNDLYSGGQGAQVGYFVTFQVNLPTWQSSTGLDANSFSSDPQYQTPNGTSATVDLHINPAQPTVVEGSGSLIASVTDDFDGQTRSGLTPVDLGADAGNFMTDVTGPVINYTPLSSGCGSFNPQTLTASITDLTGVPLSGIGLPVVYWKVNNGAYTNTQGVFIGGHSYNFTFGGTASVGDVVTYYIVAQDNATTPNVSSNPSAGAGGFTSNPPAASTPPTSPNTYTVAANLSGTYNVGVGQTYTTLTAAVADYNAKCLTGPVTFILMDANYNVNETFPITINANSYASATNTLTIKPNTTSTVTGSTTSLLIKLNGADYVTIDGSNSGGTDQSLTLTNNYTAPTVIILTSQGNAFGASNNTIKNCVLTTNSTAITGYGISLSTSFSGSIGSDNDNNTIQNNLITGPTIGIYARGTTAVNLGADNNLVITGNTITSNSTLANSGIRVGNAINCTISGNTINVQTSGAAVPVGISLETGISSSTVTRNNITQVFTSNSGSWGGRGITIGTGTATSAITISNNFISGVNGTNGSDFGNSSSIGIAIGTVGGSSDMTTLAGGINIFYNSVNMYGTYSSSTNCLTTAIYAGTGASALDFRDNIFVNSLNNTGSGTSSKAYSIYSDVASGAFTTINFNDYYVSGAQAVLGFIGSDRTNLAGIIAGFGQNANSVNVAPVFTGSSDLHLSIAANPSLDGAASPLSVTVDYDNTTRNATTPDIGADEFTAGCSTAIGGTASGSASFCISGTPAITASGYSTGTGSTYQWISSASAGAYPNGGSAIGGQTNPASLTTGVVSTTTYYWLRVTCATNASTDNSTMVTVTINPSSANISGASSKCANDPAVTLTENGGTGTSWSWSTGETTQSINVNPSSNTTYTVTVTSPGPCTASATKNVSVNPNPTGVTAGASTGTICNGQSVNLTSSASAPPAFVIMSENFNSVTAGTTTSGNLPSGWTGASLTSGVRIWGVVASAQSGSTLGGGNFLYCESDLYSAFQTRAQVVTPAFSAVGFTSVSIKFKQYYNDLTSGSATDSARVYVSNDGGANYTLVQAYDADQGTAFSGAGAVQANLPVGIALTNNMKVKLVYNSDAGGNDWYWAVDDFSIEGVPAYTYSWTSSPSGFTSSSQNPTGVSPSATTSYTVQVTGVGGCSSTASTTVNVNARPTGVLSGTQGICSGGTATLSIAATGSGTISGTLNPGAIPFSGSAPTITVNVTPGSNTTYTINTMSDANCTSNAGDLSGSAAVTISSSLTPSISGNLAFCSGSSTTLDAGFYSGYTWTGGATTQTITVSTAGTFTVTVTDGSGCTGSASATTTINPLPTPSISGTLAFCSGSSTTLDAGTYPGYSWTGGATTQTISVSTAGTFTVTVTDANGCTDSASATTTINPLPTPSISGTLAFCSGNSTTLDAGSYPGYSWSTGASAQTISVSSANTFTVTVTDGNGCSGSASATTSVNPLPTPSISGSLTFCSGGSTTLDAGAYPGYSWSTGASTQAISVSTANTFTVTVTDGNGCSGSASAATTVNARPTGVLSGTTAICPGGTATLSIAATGSGTVSGTLSPGAIPYSGTAPTITVNVSPGLTTSYTIGTMSDANCTSIAGDLSGGATVSIYTSATSPASVTSDDANNEICSGQNIMLTANGGAFGNAPGSSYKWYEGGCGTGSALGSASTLTVTPSVGSHTYYVRIEDACGNTTCASLTILVTSAPPSNSVGTPTGPGEACNGTVSLISVNTVGGPNVNYSWNTGSNSSVVLYSTNIGGPFSPGPFQTSINQVYAQFGALSGSSGYNICVQGVNGCGSTNNACDWIRGVVGVPGTITPANPVACPNDVKSYSCGVSGGATVYNWTLGGSATPVTSGQGTQNVQVTFPPAFTTAQLCVTAALSCGGSSTSAPRCMTISKNPAIPGAFTAGPSSVCPGATGVTFTVPSVTGASGYNWTVPVGCTITSGANTPSITVNFPNPYTGAPPVCVSATSACGSSTARCKTVGTNIPNQPGAVTGPTNNICNSTVQYSISNVTGATDYTWTNPAGTTITSGQNSTTILLSVSPAFSSGQLTVTANTLLCTPGTSSPRTITIYGKPNVPGTITPSPATWCSGGFVNFSITSVIPLPVYNWSVSNGTITAGQGTNNIDVTWGAGAGTVTVNAGNGCGVSSNRVQTFSSSCREEEMKSEVGSQKLKVYPNPAHDKVTVSISISESEGEGESGKTSLTLKLMDISGRVILSETQPAIEGLNTYEMDLKNFAKGVYMLDVSLGNEKKNIKVVIE